MIDSFDPDILLLDISLGDGPTGIQIAHAVSKTRPDIAILVLTKHPDPKSSNELAFDLPEKVGFLRKHLVRDTEYLLNAIEAVLADRPEIAQTSDSESARPFPNLSDKAFTVLSLLAEGFNNGEIARKMGLSLKAIERWIDIIYAELDIKIKGDLNPRVEAARRYFLVAGVNERDT
jgi:DNA-binding NarL/FixJ family response regulator